MESSDYVSDLKNLNHTSKVTTSNHLLTRVVLLKKKQLRGSMGLLALNITSRLMVMKEKVVTVRMLALIQTFTMFP